MFKELVDLGNRLEHDDKLPPTGFYEYSAPIRWLVHLWSDHVMIEATDLPRPRPFSGRTSGIEAHLLADEAAYSLGVATKAEGGEDSRADEKHEDHFRPLYRSFVESTDLRDPALREAIDWLDCALEQGWIKQDTKYGAIRSKDWVSFVLEEGPLSESHLFEHPDAKAFWLAEMQRRCSAYEEDGSTPIRGTCSVCGCENRFLIRKLPLGVKLAVNTPIHSLNQDAFTSFLGGPDTKRRTHLGICYACGDTASRAFNYLSDSDQHRLRIVPPPKRDQRDKLVTHYALYWLKAPGPVRIGEEEIDLNDPNVFDLAWAADPPRETPRAKLSQMKMFLDLPWKPIDDALSLDDYGFYLALLSPNVGRIALRDWMAFSIKEVKNSLVDFLDGTRIVSSWGDDLSPVPVSTIVKAIGTDADLTRALLRCAYTGTPPPGSLAMRAGQRLNFLNAHEHALQERQRSLGSDRAPVWNREWPQALAGAVKLGLFYRKEESQTMLETNRDRNKQAYLCGRLLALLEEAQQIYSYWQHGKRLDVSLVQRGYGGAASTPAPVIGRLLRLATVAHLPKAGWWINSQVESIFSSLDESGGIPPTLSLEDQAEFGLGFYHQRALIRGRPKSSDVGADSEDHASEGS